MPEVRQNLWVLLQLEASYNVESALPEGLSRSWNSNMTDPEVNSVFRRRAMLPPLDAVHQKQILRPRLFFFSQVAL